MKKLLVASGLIAVFSLGGCAYLQHAQNSDAAKHFCSWAPVAQAAILEAAKQAAKDPAKATVADALWEASGYLTLTIAVTCRPAVMP